MGEMFKNLPGSKAGSNALMQSAGMAMKAVSIVMSLLWCTLMGVSPWFLQRQETRGCLEAA